jgi:hypothetical protein
MVKKKKKVEVQKFGGVEDIGHLKDGRTQKFTSEMTGQESTQKDVSYDMKSLEAQSDTKLEDDKGGGGAAIIRMFEFGINFDAFKEHPPTKQELFNYHHKGIETMLWRDGMTVLPEVNPRVVVGKSTYRIFVGAKPMRGHILKEQPKTLTEQITHGT